MLVVVLHAWVFVAVDEVAVDDVIVVVWAEVVVEEVVWGDVVVELDAGVVVVVDVVWTEDVLAGAEDDELAELGRRLEEEELVANVGRVEGEDVELVVEVKDVTLEGDEEELSEDTSTDVEVEPRSVA